MTQISGRFLKGDAVSVKTIAGQEIARGLVSYDAAEAQKLLGVNSGDIIDILGYDNGAALIHRDNMVMI